MAKRKTTSKKTSKRSTSRPSPQSSRSSQGWDEENMPQSNPRKPRKRSGY